MRRSIARTEEGGVSNECISSHDQVPIVGLGEENEEVPLQEPQMTLDP